MFSVRLESSQNVLSWSILAFIYFDFFLHNVSPVFIVLVAWSYLLLLSYLPVLLFLRKTHTNTSCLDLDLRHLGIISTDCEDRPLIFFSPAEDIGGLSPAGSIVHPFPTAPSWALHPFTAIRPRCSSRCCPSFRTSLSPKSSVCTVSPQCREHFGDSDRRKFPAEFPVAFGNPPDYGAALSWQRCLASQIVRF